ncbi:MAG: DUF2442 domain-containing protein [Cyanobacteria bacterium J06634_5]
MLELVRYDGNVWVPVEATEEQLEAVDLGGDHVYWDELGQDFRISDLKAGIYGREPWMAKLQHQALIGDRTAHTAQVSTAKKPTVF